MKASDACSEMKPTTKSTIKKKPVTKRARPNVDPDCIYSYRMIPISPAMVNKMIDELVDWPLLNPKAKTITEYYLSKGLRHDSYYRLLAKYPLLKESHEVAMRRLGERLWGRAVDKEADWSAIRHRLHSYAPEFDEDNKYHARLKAEAEKAADAPPGNVQYIVIPKHIYVTENGEER